MEDAYSGGVFSPLQNRIYFVPLGQADEAGKNWHFLDCSSGNVVTYIHTLTPLPVQGAYSGGAFSPVQNRIYFFRHFSLSSVPGGIFWAAQVAILRPTLIPWPSLLTNTGVVFSLPSRAVCTWLPGIRLHTAIGIF